MEKKGELREMVGNDPDYPRFTGETAFVNE